MPSPGFKNLSIHESILKILDELPGGSRSQKLEQMILEAQSNLGRQRAIGEGESSSALTSHILEEIPGWDRKDVWRLVFEILKYLEKEEPKS